MLKRFNTIKVQKIGKTSIFRAFVTSRRGNIILLTTRIVCIIMENINEFTLKTEMEELALTYIKLIEEQCAACKRKEIYQTKEMALLIEKMLKLADQKTQNAIISLI